jgi:hypothetical protein
MPYIERSKFEKHLETPHGDDNMHVEAISNPEDAAHIAALKLVLNTHLREKLELLDTEDKNRKEFVKNIINQKNKQHLDVIHDIINSHLGNVGSHHGIIGRSI